MLKRTIEISTDGTSLHMRRGQIEVCREGVGLASIPAEDIGLLIIATREATYTHGTLLEVLSAGGVVMLCDEKHLPAALILPHTANFVMSERIRQQAAAPLPSRKRAWQQLVRAKLAHQAANLTPSPERDKLASYANMVESGDPQNYEAHGARLYWNHWLNPAGESAFSRDPDGDPPNNLLNYGYAILRAATARAICAVGLHPSFGLQHSNRYNPYPLADDLMEPYRPMVDRAVRRLFKKGFHTVDKVTRKGLLEVLTDPVRHGGETGPLLIALEKLCFSLHEVFAKKARDLRIPAPLPEKEHATENREEPSFQRPQGTDFPPKPSNVPPRTD